MSGVTSNEAKYQGLKLYHSGRISLGELKSLTKAGSVGLMDEYIDARDKKDLASLEAGIHRLTMTRADSKALMAVKFAPRPLPWNREDYLAAYYSGYRKPINWKRDGNLIRRGKPNKPRPGSSKGKWGKTRVIGAKKVLRDFDRLVISLQRLMQSGQGNQKDVQALQSRFKAMRTSLSVPPKK
jgi:hypothetical protein